MGGKVECCPLCGRRVHLSPKLWHGWWGAYYCHACGLKIRYDCVDRKPESEALPEGMIQR